MTVLTADQALDNAKGLFEHVAVIGLKKNGKVDIIPTIATYQFTQWLLNRASFELLIAEKAQIEAESIAAATEAATEVVTA